jgi:transposase InsO family protein
MKAEYPIRTLCQALEVAPSGYYDWEHRQTDPGKRATENAQLLVDIERIFKENRETYGSPRIQHTLAHQGRHHGRNRIARLMRQKQLCGRAKRKFRVLTTDSNHDLPVAPNRLAQCPAPTGPNQIWVGDITYVPTAQGWLYLAGFMDLYSRRIVGWAMQPAMDQTLVLNSWNMACTQRQPPAQLLVHSDRGSQYAGGSFRRALAHMHALPSMSRKGNCYDNAAMESFWSTLKLELIYRREFQTRTQASLAIFDYIETFYNRKRTHSSLNYSSPVDFESQTH